MVTRETPISGVRVSGGLQVEWSGGGRGEEGWEGEAVSGGLGPFCTLHGLAWAPRLRRSFSTARTRPFFLHSKATTQSRRDATRTQARLGVGTRGRTGQA